jgi:hypothetical protein
MGRNLTTVLKVNQAKSSLFQAEMMPVKAEAATVSGLAR